MFGPVEEGELLVVGWGTTRGPVAEAVHSCQDQGMKVGGRRRLTIPPDMGYGQFGAGGVIGPNETLVFVVDLRSVG